MNVKVWESAKQKLLGTEIERNLNFDGHVFSLRKKVGRKLAVLARLSKFTSFKQKWILIKICVESTFGNCPLIWMFHNRNVYSKINHLQERSLRIVYDDYVTSFEDLLKKGNIHHKNVQLLAREFFKVKKGINQFYLRFPTKIYRLQLKVSDLSVSSINITHIGLNSLRFFASKVWNMVLVEPKNLNNVEMFKSEIRKWEPKTVRMQIMPAICAQYRLREYQTLLQNFFFVTDRQTIL